MRAKFTLDQKIQIVLKSIRTGIVPSSHGAISDVAVSADGTVMLVTVSARSTAGNGTMLSYA